MLSIVHQLEAVPWAVHSVLEPCQRSPSQALFRDASAFLTFPRLETRLHVLVLEWPHQYACAEVQVMPYPWMLVGHARPVQLMHFVDCKPRMVSCRSVRSGCASARSTGRTTPLRVASRDGASRHCQVYVYAGCRP